MIYLLLLWLVLAVILTGCAAVYLLALPVRKNPYRDQEVPPRWPPLLRLAWLGNNLLVRVACPGCGGSQDQQLYHDGWGVPQEAVEESYVFPAAPTGRIHRILRRHRYPSNIRTCSVCRGLGFLLRELEVDEPDREKLA